MKKFSFMILFSLLFSYEVFSQEKYQVDGADNADMQIDLVLENGVKSHKGIDSIYNTFSEGYRTLKPELVANLYTENAAYLSPGGDIRFSRNEILKSFTRFFTNVKKTDRNMTIKFHIFQRKVEKNMGYDVGVYTLHYYKDGKMLSEHKGKFVVVAIKGKDKKWRFQVDGYSSLKPPQNN